MLELFFELLFIKFRSLKSSKISCYLSPDCHLCIHFLNFILLVIIFLKVFHLLFFLTLFTFIYVCERERYCALTYFLYILQCNKRINHFSISLRVSYNSGWGVIYREIIIESFQIQLFSLFAS